MEILHPAAREEQARLKGTLSVIKREREIADDELIEASRKLIEVRQDDPDAVPLREMLYARSEQLTRNLRLAFKKPYFTRVDFIERGGGKEVYYIGKYGVTRSASMEIEVVDWRAPIANLYYSGQLGPMKYAAPDGEVEGELTLKRQLTVENGELTAIFDTDVVSKDAYLQSVLGSMTGDRLREIVTSIQAEQNFVIRHPLNQNLVVQGVAGSGKTTIALHRIAYLLYAFPDKLRPENMLILAPNPLFLNFIAGVLPDLGVERIRQDTLYGFLDAYLGGMPRLTADPLEKLLSQSAEKQEMMSEICQYKGGAACVARLMAFLDEYEDRFPPDEEMRFGPVTLFTKEQLRTFLLVDEKPFPLERRRTDLGKELTRRVKRALETVLAYLETETARRADVIREKMPAGEAKRLRMVALYQSRDARKAEAKERAKTYAKDAMKRFDKVTPGKVLRAFWESLENEEGAAGRAARYTLAHMTNAKIEREDAALYAFCAMRVCELARADVRHVVADEAQDFSQAEFLLLRAIAPQATFTVVGDLMQGVRAWRGLTDWALVREGVFEGKCVMHYLVTSYRSTVEIMNLALRVSAKRPVPDQREAKPVLRHGDEPMIERADTLSERAEKTAQIIRDWRAAGLTSIAVIGRTRQELLALQKAMPADINLPLLDVEKAEYEPGAYLADASSVKGFEFDGAILPDAGKAQYADRDQDARLLFVCLTRPLHKLAVLYANELTPLLRG